MTPSIKATKLTRNFGAKRAVDAVDLEVNTASVFGFLGPNGAGKTTTMKLLVGLLRPTAGQSSVLGFHSWQQGNQVRQHAGVLFEEPGLYNWLTGPQNMCVMGRLWGLASQTIAQRSQDLAKQLSISDEDANLPVRKLSRGTRHKWGLCRAFLTKPKVLFLDEPTANLDPIAAREVRAQIRSLAVNEEATVFMNTHNLDEALRVCDRVGVIHRGKIVACDTPQAFQPDLCEYLIHYSGEPVKNSDLTHVSAHIHECTPSRLHLTVNTKELIAKTIAWLVETKRNVYEVTRASNPLESIFSKLESKQEDS